MASEDVGGLVFASGKLCINPSNVLPGQTFPYGGTELPQVKNCVAQVSRKFRLFTEEPFGPAPYDGLDLGEIWVLTGSFRSYDEDVINQVFASVISGASTGKKSIYYPNGNTFRAGGLLSTRGVKLLLQPDDTEMQRWFYGYNAVPITDDDAKLPFQRDEEWIVPFKFIFLPNASNQTVAYALREDLNSIL